MKLGPLTRFPIRRHEVVAAILAAGQGTRMGLPKAVLPTDRGIALQRIVANYKDLEVRLVVVLAPAQSALADGLAASGVPVVFNPKPEAGQLSSLQLAVREVTPCSAVVLHPVDHPLVTSGTLRSLLTVHGRTPSSILIPSFRGRKGHPVLFPYRFFSDLLDAPLEIGARHVTNQRFSAVQYVEVVDAAILANLNVPADLDYWNLPRPGRT